MITTERKKRANQAAQKPLVEHPPTLGTDILTGMRLGTAERKLRIGFGLYEADTRYDAFESLIGRVGIPMRSEYGFERADGQNGIRMKLVLDMFIKTAPAHWVSKVREYFARVPIISRFFAANSKTEDSVVPIKQVGNA